MKKTNFLVFSLVLLSLLSVQSVQSDVDKAYEWLIAQPNTNVFSASLTGLAVSKAETSRVNQYIAYIKSQKHQSEACWPAQSCQVKDTALALLVNTKIGLGLPNTNSEDIKNWLLNKQINAGLTGKWALEVVTQDSGLCDVSYKKLGQATFSNPVSVSVNSGKISTSKCSDQTFLDLGSCINSDILSSPSTTIRIDCDSNSFTSPKISLVYIEANTYYLVSEPAISTRTELVVNNGYFGNKENTLYANWAIAELDNKKTSFIWLKKNEENSVFDQSLLYLITRSNENLNKLKNLQRPSGLFEDSINVFNEFNNGLAGLAMEKASEDRSDLQTRLLERQLQDGSWSSKVDNTAMILYGAFQGGSIAACQPDWDCTLWSLCTNETTSQTRSCEDKIKCGSVCGGAETCITQRSCSDCTPNWDCQPWSACSEDGFQTRVCRDEAVCRHECAEDDESCQEIRECIVDEEGDFEPPPDGEDTDDEEEGEEDEESTVCVVNNLCEPEWGEDEENCPDDCVIGDEPEPGAGPPGVSTPETEPSELEPEEPTSGRLWIIVIIVLLILILVGSYFFIFKKKKPSKKGTPGLSLPSSPGRPPLFGPQTQPPPPRQGFLTKGKARKSRMEEELERSLEEAKKLLKK